MSSSVPVFGRENAGFAASGFRSASFVTAACASLLLQLLLLSPLTIRADEIILKSGKIIEGTARRTGDRVIIRPRGSDASIILSADQIETILTNQEPFGADAARNESSTSPAPAPEAHAAANPRIERPPLQLDPSAPQIAFSYEPEADIQIRSAIESVFPRILSICIEELGMQFDDEVSLNIRIIDELSAFEDYKNQNSDLHYAVEGYYAVEDDSIVVWGNDARQKMVATIYHEGTHAMLRREFDSVPSWIDEGLAEYFEGFRVHETSTVALSPQYNDGWAKRFLYEGQLIPLAEYLQLTNHEWVVLDQESRHVPRIMAWSLISYLMSSREGRHALRRYIQAIRKASPTEAMATAYQELDSAYRGGVANLERDWKSWIIEKRKAQSF